MATSDNSRIFAGRAEWRAWLEAHHADATSLWLALYKKGSGKAGLTYEEAVEEALCFGWIDGLVHALDKEKYTIRFTPRSPTSVWSENNKRRVEKLFREGRMAEPGLRLVEAARASGQWDAATRREEPALPPELEQALRARAGAWSGFEALPASRKKQLIWWVMDAKRDTTRRKRLEAVIEEALKKSASRGV
jgi:uncharacterized protein YdeI (YjbR/CyaY-like superfamily)